MMFLPDKDASLWNFTQPSKFDLDRIVTGLSEEELLEWYLHTIEASCLSSFRRNY